MIDIAATDEADAVRLAKHALSFFQGPVASFVAPDQRALRDVVPENRRRAYDVHRAIEVIADTSSTLELRPRFGRGMVTVLARIEGHPVGIVANNPMHLAARSQVTARTRLRASCSCARRSGAGAVSLRYAGHHGGAGRGEDGARSSREPSVLAGAALTVPFMTVVLRKGYGSERRRWRVGVSARR